MTYYKTVKHFSKLSKEAKAVSYKVNGINSDEDKGEIDVFLIANLTDEEQLALDNVFENFQDVYDPEEVTTKLTHYNQKLGLEIIDQLKWRNQAEGITTDQSLHYIERTKSHLMMLNEGLLKSAKELAEREIPDDMTSPEHYLTQARIDAVISDIDKAIVKSNQKLMELIA